MAEQILCSMPLMLYDRSFYSAEMYDSDRLISRSGLLEGIAIDWIFGTPHS